MHSIYDERQFWVWMYDLDFSSSRYEFLGMELLTYKVIRVPFTNKFIKINYAYGKCKQISWKLLIPFMKLFVIVVVKKSPFSFQGIFNKAKQYDYLLECIHNYREYNKDLLIKKPRYAVGDIVYVDPIHSSVDYIRNHRMAVIDVLSNNRYSVEFDTFDGKYPVPIIVGYDEIIGAIS